MKAIATDADFLIPQHRAAAMSYLQTLAATGYHYWNTGSVHYEKAAGFLAKMRALYPIDLSPGQRAVAQAKGRANAYLVMFPDGSKTGYIQWFLVATRGRHAVDPLTGELLTDQPFADLIHQREKMKDGHRIPLTWLGHYRLVQHQPVRDPRKKKSQKRVWTWRLTVETYRQWQLRLEQAARIGNTALRKEIEPLLRSPMFSGVRDDIAQLAALAEAAFRKQHKSAAYVSPLPAMLPYMPRVTVYRDGTLFSLVEQLRQQDADDKARAMAASRALLAGAEPRMQFTQSMFMEISNGSSEEEGGSGAVQGHAAGRSGSA
ncbi:hypothetical protein SAMN04488038_104204 [Solimonas aquatica]|uniref:Uncharacterized protein n=1 Tax=Solimonas aquatica TaxID=489703 RepID=A0A1H9DZV4_9GAMM|nr:MULTISPECIES: hypothetical protein [Solimonas]SEQ18208.1 hypothetical protein SAMN04488038_104204 [Solimonas aquatica]